MINAEKTSLFYATLIFGHNAFFFRKISEKLDFLLSKTNLNIVFVSLHIKANFKKFEHVSICRPLTDLILKHVKTSINKSDHSFIYLNVLKQIGTR